MVRLLIAISVIVIGLIVTLFLINKPDIKKPEPLSIVRTQEGIPYKTIDVFCLAKNIYHEAGIEDDLGKYAVAQVTINRVLHSRYPDTICDVVMDPFQFSWTRNKSIRWMTPKGPLWEESLFVAKDVLFYNKRVYGLEDAIFYHADYVSPHWKNPLAKIAKIGTHIFYHSAL